MAVAFPAPRDGVGAAVSLTSLGPFPLRVALAAAAVLLAWLAACALSRGRGAIVAEGKGTPTAGSLVLDGVLAGLLAARAGYIAQWWSEYAAAPLSMLAIGDGGLAWWAGVPAALVMTWLRGRRVPVRRCAALAGLGLGALAWGGIVVLSAHWQRAAPPLPPLALARLDGVSVALAQTDGRPRVVNLWATWCPPCRREMPVFVHAARVFPEVDFLLVNQGDDAETVRNYLSRSGLVLPGIVLDPESAVMDAVGARVLPTTLFYDAQGHRMHAHVGELSRAALADALQRHMGVSATIPEEE